MAAGRAFGLAAFVLGAAILAPGPTAVAAEVLVVRGPYAARAGFRIERLGPPDIVRSGGAGQRITIVTPEAPAGVDGRPVCVRLCDGAFFPLSESDAASDAAQCDSQCPGAATEVFYRSGGSERIEDAVSADGGSYMSLPAALRFRTASDATCACHRPAYSPLGDPTLKPGDAIMTPAGFAVFVGAEASAHSADDFVALAQSDLPRAERAALHAMEQASLAEGHPTLAQWLAALPPPPVASDADLVPGAASGGERIRVLVWRGTED